MRLLPSDPDVKTIVGRIQSNDVDLQPEFQRGEVWSEQKKTRLIDTILRDWHVPPVHVVQLESGTQEVLDGQQRLTAIRDFVAGKFAVDGKTEPYDKDIALLDGLYYGELPPKWRRQFDQFTIRVFRVTDYSTQEPGELFYRLNQPTNLTAAEQRNAFYGPVRAQVKSLVNLLQQHADGRSMFGFSNSRMAYDDVIARVCQSLEKKTIAQKITASRLTESYRGAVPFSNDTISHCERAIEYLCKIQSDDTDIRLNKATLYSWLWFLADVSRICSDQRRLRYHYLIFEAVRQLVATASSKLLTFNATREVMTEGFVRGLLTLYLDRSSSRVSDVSSVVARDVTLWLSFWATLPTDSPEFTATQNRIAPLLSRFNFVESSSLHDLDKIVTRIVDEQAWGAFR